MSFTKYLFILYLDVFSLLILFFKSTDKYLLVLSLCLSKLECSRHSLVPQGSCTVGFYEMRFLLIKFQFHSLNIQIHLSTAFREETVKG